jgi:hypothetical protein
VETAVLEPLPFSALFLPEKEETKEAVFLLHSKIFASKK